MASPQTGNGFTAIANELMDAIIAAGFSKRQLTILLYVLRKTYGFKKKVDAMSYTQIGKATNMHRRHVMATVNELADMGVLNVSPSEVVAHGHNLNNIGVNKDYEQWATSDQNSTGAETVTSDQNSNKTSDQNSNKTSDQNSHPQKKLSKRNSPKERGAIDQHRPEGVSEQTWNDFVAHRQAIKKPLTEVAAKRLANKLEKLHAEGNPPEAVLDQSIVNGWQGVFAVKDKDAGKSRGDDWMQEAI